MRYRKIAVTGGCGRLGKYVVAELRERHELTVLDRSVTPDMSEIGREVDVLEIGKLERELKGHDAVVHLAGADASWNVTADVTFRINTLGTWNVLESARKLGIEKAVVCSSSSATGFGYDVMPRYLPVDELHPPMPAGAYGLSKQLTEQISASFAHHSAMRVVCIRPGYIAFPAIIEHIKERVNTDKERGVGEPGAGPVYEEGLPTHRSYVRPEDIARCFGLALDWDDAIFDVFNVIASDSYSPEPSLEYFERIFGRLPEIRKPHLYRDDPFASLLDNSAAATKLRWEPSGTWGDIAAGT